MLEIVREWEWRDSYVERRICREERHNSREIEGEIWLEGWGERRYIARERERRDIARVRER